MSAALRRASSNGSDSQNRLCQALWLSPVVIYCLVSSVNQVSVFDLVTSTSTERLPDLKLYAYFMMALVNVSHLALWLILSSGIVIAGKVLDGDESPVTFHKAVRSTSVAHVPLVIWALLALVTLGAAHSGADQGAADVLGELFTRILTARQLAYAAAVLWLAVTASHILGLTHRRALLVTLLPVGLLLVVMAGLQSLFIAIQ